MTKENRRFHRLSTKFICGTASILVLVLAATLFVNSKVAARYYLRQQTEYVSQAGSRIREYLDAGMSPDEAVASLEASDNVLITYASNTSDYDALSSSLREKFREKGLGFQKFWLWDQDYLSAVQKGFQFRLYQQDKLNYGILVEYIPVGPHLYAVAAIVPNTADFIGIINRFSILLHAISLIITVILLYLLVKHITNPLRRMERFSQEIARQEYGTLIINTRDELEHVADSMNQMSISIQQYQSMLQAKNQQMEQLLSDVAHDLKTPISLIGMYSSGIRDGLDDGTFLETIIQQNSRMSQMTERLLNLSGIERKEYPLTTIRLDLLLFECIAEQKLFLSKRGLSLNTAVTPNLEIMGNAELVTELFSNLLSNAVKYAASGTVNAELVKNEGQCCFRNRSMSENPPATRRCPVPDSVCRSSKKSLISSDIRSAVYGKTKQLHLRSFSRICRLCFGGSFPYILQRQTEQSGQRCNHDTDGGHRMGRRIRRL